MPKSTVRALDERASQAPARVSDDRILAALEEHRTALIAGDVESVRATMAWGARPPAERDLLLDLSAAEGLPEAVAQLRKFWQKAVATTRAVRALPNGDAEVYESIEMPDGRVLSTVTLLREKSGRYLVVSTADTPDETVRIVVLCDDPSPHLDDVRFSREWIQRFGATAELILDDDDGALSHPTEGWLARVRGPLAWAPFRERLAQGTLKLPEAASVLEVSMTPPEDRPGRLAAMKWLGRAAGEVAAHVGATWAYVQRAEKIIAVDELRKALAVSERDRGLVATFVRLRAEDGWASTRGLGHLTFPEVEVELADWPDAAVAQRIVGTLAVGFVGGRVPPVPTGDNVIVVGEHRVHLEAGRRGSGRGHTHGPNGSLTVRPAAAAPTSEPPLANHEAD